jgi:hypothetical protein
LLTEYRIRVRGPSKDRNPDYRLPSSHASLPVLVDFRPDGDIGDIERRHEFEPLQVLPYVKPYRAHYGPTAAPLSRRLGGQHDGFGIVGISSLKHEPAALRRRFLIVGYFRQIFSIVTRNGRDPARLQDADDGIVHSVH